MNKKQLIARVQRHMGPGATRSTASAAVEAVLASILAAAETGEKLHIARFGSFQNVERQPRSGYNISTGKMQSLPARTHLTFTPAAHLTQIL